jgi:hypothetical protein
VRAHREARDTAQDNGNEELAELHQQMSRYHQKRAFHAARRSTRNVSLIANAATSRASIEGTEASHLDAATAHRLAAAGVSDAGDRTAVEVHYKSAQLHESHAARLHRNFVANSPLPLPAQYVGRGVIPNEAIGYAGLTVNMGGVDGPDGDDMLPLPVMNYRSFCSDSLR